MSTKYFSSDFHGHHKKVCDMTNRPWSNEKNIDECVRLVNERAKEDDVLYHLGDFSFAGTSKFDEIKDFASRLKPKLVFLLGNHDKPRIYNTLMELMPHKILGVYNYLEIGHAKTKIVICHYPIASWNRMHHGSIHLHGHTHAQVLNGKALDVGLDGVYDVFGEHKILSINEIMDFMATREIVSDGSHH